MRSGLALIALAMPVMAQAQDAAYQRDARAMLERVTSFRTAKGQGEVPKMTAYLVETLEAGGVAEADIAILPHGETNGLLVRIPGSDAKARPILFNAHMDVVDARPEDWQRSPFTLIEEDGYFFGRGVLDNKTGVVAMASTILRFKKDGVRPKRTIVFAFVGDEETEFGTTRLIAAHDWVKSAEFAINTDAGGGLLAPDGKPMIYLVQGAEKSIASFALTATNPGGHSSRPRADNAIYDLAKALVKVSEYRFPVTSNVLTKAYLAEVGKVTPGAEGEMLRRFAANPEDREASDALYNSPEFVGTTRTTCVATLLEGGHAQNALPQKAAATVNCRIFPGTPVAEVQKTLAGVVGDKIAVTVTTNFGESPVSEPTPAIMGPISTAIRIAYPGVPVAPYLESGGTDGLVYRSAGIPTFATSGVFIKAEDMFAHGLNERIPVKSFYEGVDHIHRLAVAFGGK